MKSTGIVRQIDQLGRVVIPKEIRNTLDINDRDPIEIFIDGSDIILRKHQPSCIFCGSNENITFYKHKLVCRQCLSELSELT